MAENVIILGAGASAAAGGPLMANFLDVARAIERDNQKLEARDDFRRVFKAIGQLGSVFEKGQLDTDNLESVFAAFEMAKLFQSLGSLSAEEIDALPDAMRALIVETLEQRIKLPVVYPADGTGRPAIYPPSPYGDFVRLFANPTYGNNVAVITFNYDMAIDYALFATGFPVDYCLAQQPLGGFPLMKLHGSLNWLECEQCGIAPYGLHEFFTKRSYSFLHDVTEVSLRITEAAREDQFSHCEGRLCEPKVPYWYRRPGTRASITSESPGCGRMPPDTYPKLGMLRSLGTRCRRVTISSGSSGRWGRSARRASKGCWSLTAASPMTPPAIWTSVTGRCWDRWR